MPTLEQKKAEIIANLNQQAVNALVHQLAAVLMDMDAMKERLAQLEPVPVPPAAPPATD